MDDACEIRFLADEERNFNDTQHSTPDENTNSANNSGSPNLASNVEANSQQLASDTSHDTPVLSSTVEQRQAYVRMSLTTFEIGLVL